MIYLDNAATTSPKPQSVYQAIDRAMRRYSANPGRAGHRYAIAASEAVYQAREKVGRFFHQNDVERVVFTSGCTESLNTVIHGVLKKGDHVVISSLEHNSVLRPVQQMADRGRISYSVAQVVMCDDDATIDAFRNAINEKTRMIVCTHASNVFGIRIPVERICALAHQYGVLFCLDAAQSAGVLPIDVAIDGYDYVCSPGHKGLYGPMGVGILIINSDVVPDPLIQGGTGSESADPSMPHYLPDRLESGTLNVPGIIGLSAGLDYVDRSGIGRISHKEMELIRRLYSRIKQISGVQLYTPKPDERYFVPVLSFTVNDKSSEETAAYLDQRYQIATRAGLHCAPLAHRMMGTIDKGTVRVSVSSFSTERDMQILVHALNKFSHSA